jgi:hypothetical protein
MEDNHNVTRHAKVRARQRLGIPSRAIKRLLPRILANGKRREQFSGALRRYLDSIHRQENQKDIVVWSGYIYILHENKLVTVFAVPQEYRKLLSR